MRRRTFLVAWISLSILHFVVAFGALGFKFSTLLNWFFGTAQPTDLDHIMWIAVNVLFQPGETLQKFVEATISVPRALIFWVSVILNSTLWGLVGTLVLRLIVRRRAQRHAF